jgi:hypothetical protein
VPVLGFFFPLDATLILDATTWRTTKTRFSWRPPVLLLSVIEAIPFRVLLGSVVEHNP